jgi:acyl-CoA synthetase (AMP-forming)/AMP-acid ligase II
MPACTTSTPTAADGSKGGGAAVGGATAGSAMVRGATAAGAAAGGAAGWMLGGQSPDDCLLTDRLRLWATERRHRRAFAFVDYPDQASPGRHHTLTWGRLYARAESVAALLDGMARPGDRVALLLPQGLDYVAAFLGCLLARVVAVPLFSPDLPGHESRLAAVLEDCEPVCALVNTASMQPALGFTGSLPLSGLPLALVGSHRAPGESASEGAGAGAGTQAPVRSRPAPDDLAYLQYTSGSTRTPAGVMISHRNVMSNVEQALGAFAEAQAPTTMVGWLPLFHDMGLLLSIAAPVTAGFPSVLMDPIAFLERPERWLAQLGRYPGVLSAAPNFAYDYCATRVDPAAIATLRLDRVRALINGSEPVRPSTLRRFQHALRETGLRPEALCPSYGLAEATVFVATDRPAQPPVEVHCSRDALAEGRIVAADESAGPDEAVALTACGSPFGQELRIVDPETGVTCPDGAVGEIVVRGPNVGLGYWKRAVQSVETFGALLADSDDERPWLRTGDLGALHEGRLLVTGRLKDLLIVDGRNHYPQDVEQTVQDALAFVRRDRIAVFAVPGERGESVTAVAEYRRELTPDGALRDQAASTARAHVSAAHGVRLDRLVLVPPGSVPRTSSGKVSRSACRAAFLRGEYDGHGENDGPAQDAPLIGAAPRREVDR